MIYASTLVDMVRRRISRSRELIKKLEEDIAADELWLKGLEEKRKDENLPSGPNEGP
jgi:hypothetical protein